MGRGHHLCLETPKGPVEGNNLVTTVPRVCRAPASVHVYAHRVQFHRLNQARVEFQPTLPWEPCWRWPQCSLGPAHCPTPASLFKITGWGRNAQLGLIYYGAEGCLSDVTRSIRTELVFQQLPVPGPIRNSTLRPKA